MLSSGLMFDTHCHLNFEAFHNRIEKRIFGAKAAGVSYFVIPGTNVKTSKVAVEIAEKYENVFAAVGIHPHHIFYEKSQNPKVKSEIIEIEKLLKNKKVVAIGEVGVDRHYYRQTKYKGYKVDDDFIELQKEFLDKQINLAINYKKSLILHNREAKTDLLKTLKKKWTSQLENRTVFHCCEPYDELLEFAKIHKVFIGVDGDVTYWKEKQQFVKKIPLEFLVLETDSPFLKPAGYKYPNEPKNLKVIAEFIASLKNSSVNMIVESTTKNAKRLFTTD